MAWKTITAISGVAVIGIAIAVSQETASSPGLSGKPFYPQIARKVADDLPEAHLSHSALGDPISEKAFENYLNTLDPDHSYFLASDVEGFRSRIHDLDDFLREGHIEFAFEAFEVLKQRSSERLEQVEALIEHGFDTTREERYAWSRKEAPWPADRAAQDELWRKKVKNDIVARMATDAVKQEAADAAKTEGGENPDPAAAAAPSPADSVGAGAVSAGGHGEVSVPAFDAEDLSPEETVVKRYQQFNTVLEGHDEEFVLQAYLNAFAQAYDAHSSYLSPRANEDFDIAMKLSLTGIGAELKYDDGAAKIVRMIGGGPAEQDGRLQPGDRIVAVAQDGETPVDIMFWPLYKSVRLIRGTKGERVHLHVIPASDPSGTEVRVIDIVRDTIKLEERAARSEVHSISADDEVGDVKLGVLTLPDFYSDQQGLRRGDSTSKSSSVDVKRLLNELKSEDVEGIVLDLRNNGGGSLQEAVEMTGFFIEKGPVVQVKANRRVQVLRDPHPDIVYDGPLVVLVNRLSASASEILAGALQDYERAVVVGDSKTHGKGSVQSVFPIDRFNKKLGSLKVTTAGFYRVDGQSTQLRGVRPDIVLPSPMDVMEIGEEYLPNVLSWSWVAPAKYQKFTELRDQIPELQQNSDRRLEADSRYTLYRQLLDRLEERLEKKEVSLNLDERITQARADQELDDFQERLQEQLRSSGSDDEKAADQEDLVLSEALLILRDMVRQQTLHS